MGNLTYITGNYGKYVSVKEKFENSGITIDYFKCDLEEPDINDIEFISKEKARQAFEILGTPVFVADSGFYIQDYPGNPGYPGAFVKRSGISSNIIELLETMNQTQNRNCYFLDCLTFFDGKDYFQFFGVSKGTLSHEIRGEKNKKAKSNLWFVFIPVNCSKTLAEMSDEERNNRPDNRTSATDKFIEWYIINYKNSKRLVKDMNTN
ncbi:MAG: non-canonical purine NTP pyrophosphatase [Bacilli bacterium]|nr:non-canonical purine NTP pyrophosphatase [Bacilli bacterium]